MKFKRNITPKTERGIERLELEATLLEKKAELKRARIRRLTGELPATPDETVAWLVHELTQLTRTVFARDPKSTAEAAGPHNRKQQHSPLANTP